MNLTLSIINLHVSLVCFPPHFLGNQNSYPLLALYLALHRFLNLESPSVHHHSFFLRSFCSRTDNLWLSFLMSSDSKERHFLEVSRVHSTVILRTKFFQVNKIITFPKREFSLAVDSHGASVRRSLLTLVS